MDLERMKLKNPLNSLKERGVSILGKKIFSTLGLLPSFDTGQAYRSAWFLSRLFAFCLSLSLLLNIILGSLMISLFPLKKIQPVFLTLHPKGDQVVRIEPFLKNVDSKDLVTEALLRRYIQLRETLDFQTEELRWRELSFFHSQEVGGVFERLMNPDKNKDSPYTKRLQSSMKRGVRITSVLKLSDVLWQVEWESDETKDLEVKETHLWTSTFTLEYAPQTVRSQDALINPNGLLILDYFISERSKK